MFIFSTHTHTQADLFMSLVSFYNLVFPFLNVRGTHCYCVQHLSHTNKTEAFSSVNAKHGSKMYFSTNCSKQKKNSHTHKRRTRKVNITNLLQTICKRQAKQTHTHERIEWHTQTHRAHAHQGKYCEKQASVIHVGEQ